MKPQEAELVSEISKLQSMVSELRTGFTSALRELSQIQHGDTYLREELEENRRSCQKKALRLEVLVEALREELGVMSLQVVQLSGSSVRPQQDAKRCTCKQRDSGDAAVAAMSSSAGGRPPCECSSSSPSAAGLSRGKLLLHCFLQGLKAGLNEGTDARHQVAMQLLHSEWEYVSTLNQLYDTYQSPAALPMRAEPHQTYLKLVEQLQQRHVAFRNTLQERLSAEHWKSLVGDILVQLIGHNDTAFSDMYVGYTTTLASFIQLEFNRLNQKSHKLQGGQVEKEEMKLLSSLLAPVARLHGYLSHIQNLLQWTRKEHPDCSLLLGTERALRSILTRCHVILEEEVCWEEEEGQSCSDAAAGTSSTTCCSRSHQTRESHPRGEESHPAAQSRDGVRLTNGVDGCHSMRLECWSCSPVRRKGAAPNQPAHDCGHAYCSLLTPEAAGWGENSDSGQGTFSQLTGKDAPPTNHSLEDGETDPDDTSAFDYSSVTSCSPDGTLRREALGSHSGGEEEEEDSQVPVLLKPSYSQQPKESPRERTMCVRWQIPRLTPHPPLRKLARPYQDGPAPCLVSSYGSRLVSVRRGSPPLHPKSAFRPIWDDPSKQADAAPEKDSRPGFVPIRPNFQNFPPSGESLSVFRPGPAQQRGNHAASGGGGGGGVWDDSEDSEGPCSTV